MIWELFLPILCLLRLPLDEGHHHLMKTFRWKSGAGLLYVISHGNQVRLQGGRSGSSMWHKYYSRQRHYSKWLGQKVAHRSLSPGWRIALCTAGSRSSSNIITMFLPCLYLLQSPLQSSLSQRGSLRWFMSSLLSLSSLSLSSEQTPRIDSHWL